MEDILIMEVNHNNHKVKVSIGLPVYNGERFIRNAINTILSQKFTDIELIISDNASTDGTKQICQEYANRDMRVKYFKQSQTVPIVENFVNVLQLAQGNCFMWATHDDYYDSDDYITILYDKINEGYTLVFPNSNIIILNSEGHIVESRKGIFNNLHRKNVSKYEMCKDFVKVYGVYLYGMHIYGMFKTDRLRQLVDYLRKYSKKSVYYAEGSFLHKIFSCERCYYVDNIYFNYIAHGKNESANIAIHTQFITYLYYTYYIINIYLLSSFSVYEKITILTNILIMHYYQFIRLSFLCIKKLYSEYLAYFITQISHP
jgi:glycosyltransferase involved in cell wall biosynthesis